MMRFERFETRSYVLEPALITIIPSDGATVCHSVDLTRGKHSCRKNNIVVKLEKTQDKMLPKLMLPPKARAITGLYRKTRGTGNDIIVTAADWLKQTDYRALPALSVPGVKSERSDG